MIDACVDSQVKRVICITHTQPSLDSKVPYIRAKAMAEEYIMERIPSYGFVRPCAIFGDTPYESMLINNIAYLVRKMPIMMFPYSPDRYYFQPVHVRDLAEMAVNLGFSDENTYVDAVGPEKMSYIEVMNTLKKATNSWTYFHTNPLLKPRVTEILSKPIDWIVNDIIVDEGELTLLTDNIACSALSQQKAKEQGLWGKRALSEWIELVKDDLGKEYLNHFDRYYDMKGRKEFKNKI